MSKTKIYFIGFLANTDSSIIKVNFDHNFKIEALPLDKATKMISNLRGLSSMNAGIMLNNKNLINNKSSEVYFISNNFYISDKEWNGLNNEVIKFDNDNFHGYLYKILKLMRLYKEGNIHMPLRFYYSKDNGIISSKSGFEDFVFKIAYEKFGLKDSEIMDFGQFISNIKIPFDKSYIQLALDNYDLSAQIYDLSLSFLSVMNGLEALYNQGNTQISYTISRCTAVLIGKNEKECLIIYKRMKKLYNLRSTIIHKGELKKVKKEELLELRNYLRESIKEANRLNLKKDKLFEFLNKRGFIKE